jgi:hypothetical protein
VVGRVAELGEGEPTRFDGLIEIRNRGDLSFEAEDEGGHDDSRPGAAASGSRTEGAFEISPPERYTALLAQFAEGGIEEVRVHGFTAASRKGPMAGPWVAGALGTAHEQHGIDGGTSVQNGHCRAGFVWLLQLLLWRQGRRRG